MHMYRLVENGEVSEVTYQGDLYVRRGMFSVLRNRFSRIHSYVLPRKEQYQVVTYELVEINRQSLEEFLQGSSKG